MPTVIDQAICIRVWDWSETSQTVTLFGREQGVIRGIAKGAKREKARFSGGLEALSRGEVIAIIKPSVELATLTAWDLRETFPALRRSLSSFYSGMYLADLVRHALHEHDPHPALFDRLLEALRELGDAAGDRRAVLRFQWEALVEAGYRPEVERDARSGAVLPAVATYGFSPRLGGFVLDGGGGAPGPVWRVRGETLSVLRDIAAGGALEGAGPGAIDRASRLLAAHWREVLGREVPSMSALFGEIRP